MGNGGRSPDAARHPRADPSDRVVVRRRLHARPAVPCVRLRRLLPVRHAGRGRALSGAEPRPSRREPRRTRSRVPGPRRRRTRGHRDQVPDPRRGQLPVAGRLVVHAWRCRVFAGRGSMCRSPTSRGSVAAGLGSTSSSWIRASTSSTSSREPLAYAHWVPDHVYSTMYSYVVFPEFAFHGTITFQGMAHDVSGIGAFDHVNGRNVASPTSPGVGFWHYDPVMWEGGGVSNILYFVGSAGQVVVGTGVTTVPDGAYHPAPRCSVEHLEIADGGPNSGVGEGAQAVPRKWASPARGSARHARIRGPGRAGSRAVRRCRDGGELALLSGGRLRGSDGAASELRGRGYGEFMGGSVDISSLPGNPVCVPGTAMTSNGSNSAPGPESKRKSPLLRERVTADIRRLILENELQPGQPLREEHLASTCSASPGADPGSDRRARARGPRPAAHRAQRRSSPPVEPARPRGCLLPAEGPGGSRDQLRDPERGRVRAVRARGGAGRRPGGGT